MKFVILLSLLFVGSFCMTFEERLTRDLFQQWKVRYEKIYGSDFEEELRFLIFSQNYRAIVEFNAMGESVTLGLNEFADLTQEEFSAVYTGSIPPLGDRSNDQTISFDVKDLPTSVDWRTKGAVTPIKNQGLCGSCWAFSTVGALEGLYFLNNSQLLSFSEQNIVDCVTDCQQCGGGWPFYAYNFTAKNGIETEDDYPYTGQNENCTFDASKAHVVNSGYYNVTPKSEDQLKAAVVGQPTSVCLGASGLAWQFYKGGVIKKYCNDGIDHCVLVVGYGTIDNDDAYIVKNSWGANWGADGYVYISTDPTVNQGYGVCGILMFPTIPYKN